MERRRSSTVRQNQMRESTKSSLIRQGAFSSATPTVLLDDQKDVSVKTFVQSCPYRIEDIDRNAIIKRQDMEASLKRLSTRDDVYGVMVTTMDGRILHECDALKNWNAVLAPLCLFARHLVRDNDPTDIIQALRLRTKAYEIIITIRDDQLLIVIQMISSSGKNNDMSVCNNMIEEDWEAFLQRLQQQKMEKKD